MKFIITAILFLFLNNTENTFANESIDRISVDKLKIGMTIKEMKTLYENSKFIEEPVCEYGIDGESMGIVVVKNNNRLFFVWTLLGDDKIRGITILSPKIIIDENVHVGMKLSDFLKKYPNQKLMLDLVDERIEYCYIPKKKYRIEFLTTKSTRVSEFDYNEPEPKSIRILKKDARIDRISVN